MIMSKMAMSKLDFDSRKRHIYESKFGSEWCIKVKVHRYGKTKQEKKQQKKEEKKPARNSRKVCNIGRVWTGDREHRLSSIAGHNEMGQCEMEKER